MSYKVALLTFVLVSSALAGCMSDPDGGGKDDSSPDEHYELTLDLHGEGSVETELLAGEITDGLYSNGSLVRLTALPAVGHEFGGWSVDVQDVINPVEVEVSSTLNVSALFFSGLSCEDSEHSDVFGDVPFATTHPIGSQAYGCLIVDEADGFPVFDGNQTARFEVRAGDCSGNEGFDDCANDRSRHEIHETMVSVLNESTIIYSTSLFLPSQSTLKPKGNNILILSQVDVANSTDFTALSYVMLNDQMELFIQTHEGFTWTPANHYSITDDPFDRWINITYEIYTSSSESGFLKFYIDGELIGSEERPTLLSDDAHISLRLGIYNAFMSNAQEAFANQVMYVDGVSKSVEFPDK